MNIFSFEFRVVTEIVFMLGNIECIKLGDRLCFTLYISVANFG